MLDNIESSLFKKEKGILEKVRNRIRSGEYESNPLLEHYSFLVEQFGKMLKEFEKIVKISDKQQEYLQQIQSSLKKEISERIKAEEKLKYLATMDSLTGVYNRGTGLSILEKQLKTLARNEGLLAICFIDINGLKYVNDNYGHTEGDELLVMLCQSIKEAIRDCDTICRLGGDEFLIVLPQCTVESAGKIIDRIGVIMNEMNRKASKPYPISFSYGTVQVDENSKESIDELIELADRKMYEHKQKTKTAYT